MFAALDWSADSAKDGSSADENTEISEDPLDDDGTDGSEQQKKDLLDQDD